MSEPEYLTEDPLFLALTRPTLWFGVPVEATLAIGMASVFTLMVVGNPIWALAIGGALLGAARLIVRADYNMFKIIFLFGRTKAPAPNKSVWGIAGQVTAIERALISEKDCATTLHLVAATRGAMNGLMDAIIESHVREHVARPDLSDDDRAAGAEQLIAAIRRYSK